MAKEVAKKENKNKKHFFKDFKAELKKVIWPTPKQLFKNTVAVIFIVIVTAAIVFVLDLAFDALNTYGVNKLKSAIKNSVNTEESIIENTTEVATGVDDEAEADVNTENDDTQIEVVEE